MTNHNLQPESLQLSLFDQPTSAAKDAALEDSPPIGPDSPLSVARVWFRQHLIDIDRPENTVQSYAYDLVVLENRITDKPLMRISETDIAMYLADASSKVTRKRRLTSAKALFHWLNADLKVLKADPTSSFVSHPLEHTLPDILTAVEQQALIEASMADEPWSTTAILMMMRLGLGRTELLAVRRDHIDRTADDGAAVLVAYDQPGKRAKQRTILADQTFADVYSRYVTERNPKDFVFPYGPQAINGMVDRVAALARIERKVTPQMLRHTAAVAMARIDNDVNSLLAQLGLANDARNRETVRLYIALSGDSTPG